MSDTSILLPPRGPCRRNLTNRRAEQRDLGGTETTQQGQTTWGRWTAASYLSNLSSGGCFCEQAIEIRTNESKNLCITDKGLYKFDRSPQI